MGTIFIVPILFLLVMQENQGALLFRLCLVKLQGSETLAILFQI